MEHDLAAGTDIDFIPAKGCRLLEPAVRYCPIHTPLRATARIFNVLVLRNLFLLNLVYGSFRMKAREASGMLYQA